MFDLQNDLQDERYSHDADKDPSIPEDSIEQEQDQTEEEQDLQMDLDQEYNGSESLDGNENSIDKEDDEIQNHIL